MKHSARTVAAALAVALAVSLPPCSATAEPKGRRSEELIRIVRHADPGTSTTGRVQASRGTVRAGGVEVALDARGEVSTVGNESVLGGGGVDYVSRAVQDGFQVAAVIGDPGQSVQTYRFPGSYLELTGEGSVIVRSGGRTGEPVAAIDPAWAVDARGVQLGSRFSVEGDTLTQATGFGRTTTFPVVADPRVRTAWYGLSVDFGRSETHTIAVVADGCAIAAAAIPHTGARIAFIVACGAMRLTARTAEDNNKCLSVKFIASAGYGPVPWVSKCYK